ncbi:putative invertase inhibitor-like [Capsicum annuum]|uniref:uncharacterized protein LOC107864490 n=1 Tax=Capsicum annuum TaxID=4072 RepID=UPI001FB0BE4E|nr:uncharacterized protein LOC107864490 [Capsicum annuum]KAF3619776.1 putative invertase inhibitor-like [Capsicum annuum]
MENSSENDVDSLRRKIKELREIQRSVEEPEEFGLELKKLLEDCTLQFESKVEQILCDASEVSFSSDQDLDEFWKYLKNELSAEEAKNAKIEEEIERLSKEYVEGYSKLVNEIEGLSCPLEIIESLGLEQGRVLNKGNLSSAPAEYNFKIFELGNQLEKSKLNLKSLEDLESTFNRFEAIEQIEDAFSGLKIVEFEGNHIRLSLRTFIPNLENLPHNHTIDVAEPPEQNHELLIELMDGTMELKHVEIFPNDVSISEITDAAKSFRQVYSPVGVLEKRSSLEWFVKSVQDRIVLCTLRRFLVKSANSARHTFDYVDREETIVAHMVGGVDAFIKLPQGWPLISSGLTLMSLKSSSQYSQEISLTLLCKVAEVANSLDTNARQTISGFTDRIEEILVQQMTAVTST